MEKDDVALLRPVLLHTQPTLCHQFWFGIDYFYFI